MDQWNSVTVGHLPECSGCANLPCSRFLQGFQRNHCPRHCPVLLFLHSQSREGIAGLGSHADVGDVWGSRVCPPKYAFWDIDYFKLTVVRKHKTQEEPLTFPLTA